MTKFKEMCKAYTTAQHQFRDFQEASINFAEMLWTRMIEYFKVPPTQTTLYEINSQGGFELANPPFTTFMHLRQDGYWQFGAGITVYEQPDAYPRDTILLYLMVRRNLDGTYNARLGGVDEVFVIHPDRLSDFESYFEHLFQMIMGSYKTGLDRLLQENTTNRIGFDIGELTKEPRKGLQS